MLRGVVLIALAAVSWGTTGSVITVLVTRAGGHPLVIGAARMWIASALLLLATRSTGTRWPLDWARLRPAIVLGACLAAFQVTYFTAVTMTGIMITALIAICAAPLMIAGLAVVVLGERPRPRVVSALALGVVGTALLVLGPRAVAPGPSRFAGGAALALAAALSYAAYVVVAKAALAHTPPLPLAALTFTAAAVLLTPLAATTPAPIAQLERGWPWLLYLGVVTTAAAYVLYTIGLRRVPASVAAIVSLCEPLTAALLGTLLFGERLGAAGAIGGVLLIAAVMLVLGGGTHDVVRTDAR